MRSIDKDKAWLRYKKAKEFVKENQITYSQMYRPTEENVQKCVSEMKITTRATKDIKRIGRMLGEPTNTDKMRRKW